MPNNSEWQATTMSASSTLHPGSMQLRLKRKISHICVSTQEGKATTAIVGSPWAFLESHHALLK